MRLMISAVELEIVKNSPGLPGPHPELELWVFWIPRGFKEKTSWILLLILKNPPMFFLISLVCFICPSAAESSPKIKGEILFGSTSSLNNVIVKIITHRLLGQFSANAAFFFNTTLMLNTWTKKRFSVKKNALINFYSLWSPEALKIPRDPALAVDSEDPGQNWPGSSESTDLLCIGITITS